MKQKNLAIDSLNELKKPHVWIYLAIFSGFWFMFMALFDVLPAHIAPTDKKAMYLVFSQLPQAIGWALEGKIGLWLYHVYASKDTFSRDLLQEKMADGSASLPGKEQLTQWAQELGRPVEEF